MVYLKFSWYIIEKSVKEYKYKINILLKSIWLEGEVKGIISCFVFFIDNIRILLVG